LKMKKNAKLITERTNGIITEIARQPVTISNENAKEVKTKN